MERHGARKKHRAVPDHTTTPDPATWPDETIPPLVLTFKVRASNGLLLSKTALLTPDTEQSGSCHNWGARRGVQAQLDRATRARPEREALRQAAIARQARGCCRGCSHGL